MIECLNDTSGKIVLYDSFDLTRPLALNEWLDESVFSQEEISLFGKKYLQPRLIRFEGDQDISYAYSKKIYCAKAWSPTSLELREKLRVYTEAQFNCVLINLYRNGSDSMGLHADNEKELGVNPVIASVSYGETRKIYFKKNDGSQRLEIPLTHGSLLIMSGNLQNDWKHEIRKSKKVLGPRVNYTFRTILTS